MQIESGLYRRQGKAITNFQQTLPAPQSDLAQQMLKDPYNFDFLTLSTDTHERDGVMIATGDHQHAKLCIEVVEAGKDCYVEKPFANVLSEAKAARAAVKASKQMVQMGTQHRSQPYPLAVRDLIRSGRIGEVVKITQEWNVNQPRWRK